MSPTYYQILGVAATASAPEIKGAYKRLAIRYHPDKHGGSSQYEEQFKQVNLAYQVLSDPARRASYDQQLLLAARRAAAPRPAPQYAQHVYGVPMPPPAPLRTRPPAAAAERHYRTIPQQRVKFNRRDYWVLFGLAVLFILFLLSVKVTMDHVTATSNYEDGMRAYKNRNWGSAHSFFSEAIHFKPTYPAARRYRAEIEYHIYKNNQAALTDYRVALAQQPDTALAAQLWSQIGQCQAQQQPDSALASLTQALTLDSTLTAARFARADLYLIKLGQYEAAIQDFSTCLRQYRSRKAAAATDCLIYRGLAYYKLQDFPAAQTDYQEALRRTPQSGLLHFLLGRLAQQQGNTAAACQFFTRATQLGYAYASTASTKECR